MSPLGISLGKFTSITPNLFSIAQSMYGKLSAAYLELEREQGAVDEQTYYESVVRRNRVINNIGLSKYRRTALLDALLVATRVGVTYGSWSRMSILFAE
jgi:hypothetical protein